MRIRLALPALSACVLMSCGDPISGPAREFASAKMAVNRWVTQHPDGWTLRLSDDRPLGRPSWSAPCSFAPPSGLVVLRLNSPVERVDGPTEIDLFFRCPVDGATDAATLAATFSHIALSKLPHGIQAAGWEFDVLTPSSSFSSGVTFADAGAGKVRVSIETMLFAVWGSSRAQECQPPADSPSPEGCWVEREHRVPLDLTLVFPVSAATLR